MHSAQRSNEKTQIILETTINNVASIIKRWLSEEESFEVAAGNAADEIVTGLFWRPISEAPKKGQVDLLSNGAIRFTNCFYDKNHNAWVSRIQYKDSDGHPQVIYNVVLNPTHFFIMPNLND